MCPHCHLIVPFTGITVIMGTAPPYILNLSENALDGLDEEELPEAVAPLPTEVKESLEAEYPVLRTHGTHDAAIKGLQTDASGSYDRSKL